MTRKKSSKSKAKSAPEKRDSNAGEAPKTSVAPPLLGTVIRAGGGFYEVDPHEDVAAHFVFPGEENARDLAHQESVASASGNVSNENDSSRAKPREYSPLKSSPREAMQAAYAELELENENAPRTLLCRARGVFHKGAKTTSQPVAVGDDVRVRPLASFGPDARGRRLREGYIEEVLPRRQFLGRARFNKTAQVTVANLDQVVIVMSLREPEINLHRLDRFLVLAEASSLRPIICLNKADLMKKRELTGETKPILALYQSLGYETLITSAEKETGIEELRASLSGHISAVLGSSGVGKSSLINAVQPGLHLWVGDVMEIGKGRHTTTEVSLHKLDGGGYIADTPGIKTVALLERDELNVEQCFPDFREYSPQCRFNNCRHDQEPKCAVRAAAEEKKIAPSRYESYLRILNSPSAESSVFVSLLR